MFQKRFVLCTCAVVLAAAVACSKQSQTPVSPGGTAVDTTSPAAADGSTLKVTAPSAVSPINNAQPDTLVLVATRSTGKFTTVAVSYEFEIYNAANTRVYSSGVVAGEASGNNVAHTVPTSANLAFDAAHTWRVRAVSGTAVGPWSAAASFRSAAGGFIRGNELYDPLTNGPSIVMQSSNDVTWLPGVGVRLNSKESVVQYRLQQPCVDCEMSALMTNLGNGSEEWKTKVLSMLRGDGINITDNPYRVTLDKRTTWADQGSRIRFTMCSQKFDPTEECGEPRGGFQTWNRSQTYFWHFTWSKGAARLRVFEGGKNGRLMEDISGGYDAPYAPNPHLIRLGSVQGRAGSDTNPGTIIWNIWVSPNPRPNLPGDK
jgi:hypothetical protein